MKNPRVIVIPSNIIADKNAEIGTVIIQLIKILATISPLILPLSAQPTAIIDATKTCVPDNGKPNNVPNVITRLTEIIALKAEEGLILTISIATTLITFHPIIIKPIAIPIPPIRSNQLVSCPSRNFKPNTGQ